MGEHRNAIVADVAPARDWKTNPPKLLWRRNVGAGWGSFAIAGGRAFTQEQRGDKECVVCYDLYTGRELWRHADDFAFRSPLGGPGPRATPMVADDRVYAVGAEGRLNCLDAETGKRVWFADILQGDENTFHGVTGSPLIHNDWVIVSPPGPKGPCIAAYNRNTGKRVWSTGNDRATYSSPTIATLAGVEQVLLHHEEGVASFDLSTRRECWSFPWTNHVNTNVAQPLVHAGGEDQVMIACGYGIGAAMLQVAKSEDDEWSVKELWTSKAMKTKFCTAVIHGDYAYGLDDGILACIDIRNGRKKWKGGRYGHGQVLLAGDMLIVQTEAGGVRLVEPSPKGLREKGGVEPFEGKTWNPPALAYPFLVVRNAEFAACYELQE